MKSCLILSFLFICLFGVHYLRFRKSCSSNAVICIWSSFLNGPLKCEEWSRSEICSFTLSLWSPVVCVVEVFEFRVTFCNGAAKMCRVVKFCRAFVNSSLWSSDAFLQQSPSNAVIFVWRTHLSFQSLPRLRTFSKFALNPDPLQSSP